jgi:hypothetical protein
MNTVFCSRALRAVAAALPLVAWLLGSCSTTPPIDWNSRVGNYTFDQAVAELGPPDKQAKLSDGRTVAEWITGRSGGGALSVGTGVYGRSTGVGVSQTVGTGGAYRVLRLVFDKDGKLESWTK